MIKFKRLTIALLALLTVSATAWAQETITVTWTLADLQADAESTTFTKDGVTIQCDTRMSSGKSFIGPVTISTTLGNFTKIEITSESQALPNFTNVGNVSTWTGNTASLTFPSPIDRAEQFVFTIAPSGPEVTINDDKSEATFTMPQYDVTATYAVKRDMGVEVGLKVNGKQTWGDDVAKIQVKKQNAEYPTATTLEIVATDLLEDNATIENGNYTLLLQRLNADGETWQDLTLSDAKLTPGTYSITAKAADGTSYVNEAAGKFDIIEGYEVTVAAGEYITYYRDEALTLEETETAAELYTISSVTDKEAVLSSKLTVAPKNTPLLVYNNSNEDKTFLLIPTDAVADNVTAADEFKGTLEATTIPASTTSQDNYALNGKAFVWVKNAIEVGANKCWLQIGEQPAATRANTRSITGNGDTTGVETIDNGQLTIDNYYDLNGRKVAMPNKKGIYIKNGQKVVVK